MFARLVSLLRALTGRGQFEADLSEEFRFHVQSRADALMREGYSEADARRRARTEFGALEATKEGCREARGLRWPDELRRNVLFGLRLLRRSPGFAIGAILTLGLCIGANTAVFSVVDSVLLRPLPYPHPDRLFQVVAHYRSPNGEGTRSSQDGLTWEQIRQHVTVAESAASSGIGDGVNLVTGGQAQYVPYQRVSAGFFSVLGVRPLAGREFTRIEDQPGGASVAVVSHGLAVRLFGSPRAAIGQVAGVRGDAHTIVGVMPRDFRTHVQADLWTPLRPSARGEGQGANYTVIVRIAPDGTRGGAETQIMAAGAAALREQSLPAGFSVQFALIPLQQGQTLQSGPLLLLLAGAVGAILLIGCVNVAGLLLARSRRRAHELAIRTALGGGRPALVRQLLTESVVLAVCGGLCGLAFGAVGQVQLERALAEPLGLWQPVDLDLRVLAATAGVAMLSCLLFGLLPALRTSRVDVRTALVATQSRAVAGVEATWPRHALVFLQVTVCVVLLVGAGLLIRTFDHLRSLEPGFEPAGVLTASLSLNDARYETADAINGLFERSLDALRRIPGVESAAVGLTVPYERALNLGFEPRGTLSAEPGAASTDLVYVTPDYFQTLNIPLRAGRGFRSRDAEDGQAVIVVNQAFVDRYLGDAEPIGEQLALSNAVREIVGVTGNVQQRSAWGGFGPLNPAPTVYLPARQGHDSFFSLVHTWFSPTWVVRTTGPAQDVAVEFRGALTAVDPALPIVSMHPMTDVIDAAVGVPRVQAILLATLAALALALAAVGTYGLVASSVHERTRELGIRLALGATLSQVVRAAAAPGVVVAVGGLVTGGVISAWLVTYMDRLVWGIEPTDPTTFAVMSVVLLGTASIASLLPSLQIARLEPLDTLRDE